LTSAADASIFAVRALKLFGRFAFDAVINK